MRADIHHPIRRNGERHAASHRRRAIDDARPSRRPGGRTPNAAPETALELLLDTTDSTEPSLREVAQTLSHELRTPLTTLYSGSKLLSRHSDRLSNATVREVSTAMAADAERLLRTVEDLVVAAALPGERQIHGEPMLLQRIVRGIAQASRARWPGTRIDVELSDHLPAVRADEVHVEQVIRNLLDNAARYGPSGRPVTLQAGVVGVRLEIHVLDRGPGVAPEQAEQVFRLFARPGTADHEGGLGLGLFVCRRLVELMGGHIWVTPRPGGGSDFAFDLAVYPVDER